MRLVFLCLLGYFLLSTASIPVAAFAFEEQTAADIKTLQNAKMFCIGGFGFAGRKTEPDNALRRLLKSKDAVTALQKILESKAPEAKAYALCGLRLCGLSDAHENMPLFLKLSEPYLSSSTTLSVGRGCTVGNEKFSKVVREIRSGQYDFRLSRETQQKKK